MSTEITKVSFNAIPSAIVALNVAADRAGLNRTDTLNRAVQVYAAVTTLGSWASLRVILAERATVRRFAEEA